MIWLTPFFFVAALQDPRVTLSDLQMRGQLHEALAYLEHRLSENPQAGDRLGLHYWKGRLQEEVGDPEGAADSFATSLSTTPLLVPWSTYHLALTQEEMGHPEVAAGLVARLLEASPKEPLMGLATTLLARTVGSGGECQLLQAIPVRTLPRASRRSLELTAAQCAARGGETDGAARIWQRLLEEKEDDEVALAAARSWAATPAPQGDWQRSLLLGRVLHQHRDFARSHRQLLSLVTSPPEAMPGRQRFEARYLWIRGNFLQGAYREAAASYGRLAADTKDPTLKARALYQRGRSLELSDQEDDAPTAYLAALAADPDGPSAAPSLLATLRLEWLEGRESDALEHYRALARRSDARRVTARAALFMAASDLSRGRSDRAGTWLLRAFVYPEESAFWSGRAAAENGDIGAAVKSFAGLLVSAPHHPLSLECNLLLQEEPLRTAALKEGRNRSKSMRASDLVTAWHLLRLAEPEEAEDVAEKLRRMSAPDSGPADYSPLPPAAWPVWSQNHNKADEMLLSIGQWSEGRTALPRTFPLSDPALALTASQLLSLRSAHRRALYKAEVLRDQIRDPLPLQVYSRPLAEALYPLAYRPLIEEASRDAGIEPLLLASLIREESRFDARALSAASARGLTQFTLPTATRVATDAGLPPVSAEDLYRPQASITLGALHLAELHEALPTDLARIGAYNAGEDQARLWRRYCFTDDRGEYFTKIGFTQTRNYVARVLSSYDAYRALYGLEGAIKP